MPVFEIGPALRFERWRFSNERHGDRREHETERASPQILSGRHCTLPPEFDVVTGTERGLLLSNTYRRVFKLPALGMSGRHDALLRGDFQGGAAR